MHKMWHMAIGWKLGDFSKSSYQVATSGNREADQETTIDNTAPFPSWRRLLLRVDKATEHGNQDTGFVATLWGGGKKVHFCTLTILIAHYQYFLQRAYYRRPQTATFGHRCMKETSLRNTAKSYSTARRNLFISETAFTCA